MLVPLFGLGAERRKLDAVLRTYLGAAPGREVLAGQIRRGDVRRLEAVVMLTDLRGFTAMTASASEAELLATLDGYFEVVADAVPAAGEPGRSLGRHQLRGVAEMVELVAP